jgi:hypothetical protein
MSKPGKGRPFKKDITYTDPMPKSKIKDFGIPQNHSKPSTGGFSEVASTPAPERPFTDG